MTCLGPSHVLKLFPEGFDDNVLGGGVDLPRGRPTGPVGPFGPRDLPPQARGRRGRRLSWMMWLGFDTYAKLFN